MNGKNGSLEVTQKTAKERWRDGKYESETEGHGIRNEIFFIKIAEGKKRMRESNIWGDDSL